MEINNLSNSHSSWCHNEDEGTKGSAAAFAHLFSLLRSALHNQFSPVSSSFSFFTSTFTGAGLKSLSFKRLTTRGFLAPLPIAPLQPAATEHCIITCPSQGAT